MRKFTSHLNLKFNPAHLKKGNTIRDSEKVPSNITVPQIKRNSSQSSKSLTKEELLKNKEFKLSYFLLIKFLKIPIA